MTISRYSRVMLKLYGTLALTVAGVIALPDPVLAQEAPTGIWKTIDDASGKPRALVSIVEFKGVLTGKVEKLFYEVGDERNPRCMMCSDARKDQPVIGMTILSGLKREGNAMVWSGGEILDPDNGKIYKSKATLVDGGRKLEVRGYVGLTVFGRTQTWLREP